MRVLIVGSGSTPDISLLKKRYEWADLVIAADGGGVHLLCNHLIPHVLLGDFDSISLASLDKLKAHPGIEVFSFSTHKDFTDMELAINLAIERGATEVVLMGASGSRLDHTTQNIFLLYPLLEKGIKASLEDDHNQVFLTNRTLSIKKQGNQKVSLLSLTPCVEGLTTEGLSYPLNEATLRFGSSWGISNEFLGETAAVTLSKGLLLVILSMD